MIQCLLVAMALGLVFPAVPAGAAGRAQHIDSGKMHLDGIGSATWSGSVTIRGRLKLDIDRIAGGPEPIGPEISLCFQPDRSSMALLPTVAGSIYPDSPRVIDLGNRSLSNLAAAGFLSSVEVARIQRERFGHYEWIGTLVLKDLQTDTDCECRRFRSVNFEIRVNAKDDKHATDAVMGC